MIFSYFVSAIAALYGLLSAVAAIAGLKQNKKGDTAAMMIFGGCLMIAAAIVCVLDLKFDWINALCGSILISLAAFINGKRSELHLKHHIIRAAVEIALVIGFMIL